MKNILLIAAALTAATPAVAHDNAAFVGPRVEVNAGLNDLRHNDVSYGGAVGYDVALGDRFTLGADATTENTFTNTREFGAGARLGYALKPNALVYVRAGYTDFTRQHNDGYNVGGGFNFALTRNLYSNVEYRYTDLGHNVDGHSGRLGLGFRF